MIGLQLTAEQIEDKRVVKEALMHVLASFEGEVTGRILHAALAEALGHVEHVAIEAGESEYFIGMQRSIAYHSQKYPNDHDDHNDVSGEELISEPDLDLNN